MNQLGIDASEGDGVITWKTAALHGIKFATIRATWGVDGWDKKYAVNMAGAKLEMIARSPYHWFVPRVNTIAQVNWFIAHSQTAELPRMLDLEDYSGHYGYIGIGSEIDKFGVELQRQTGEVMWIYTSPSYINNYLKGCTYLSRYPLVIAHWEAAAPSVPLPWNRSMWRAWQFTGKGDAPYYGITQCHDCSLYTMQ
jgi:lysozyme